MDPDKVQELIDNATDIAENVVDHLASGIEAFQDMLECEYDIDITDAEAEDLVELIHSYATEAIITWGRRRLQ